MQRVRADVRELDKKKERGRNLKPVLVSDQVRRVANYRARVRNRLRSPLQSKGEEFDCRDVHDTTICVQEKEGYEGGCIHFASAAC